MSRPAILEADLTWTGDGFAAGVQVVVGPDGRIAEVGRLARTPAVRLRDRALVPGFVDTHSHAFQRGLRGSGETFPAGAGSFWTWREAMYALVERLDADDIYDLSLLAFREMRAAGITTVGEFHYLHHSRARRDWALDRAVLRAAAAAGIRIVLLQSYYRTGAVGKPLAGGQERFDGVSPEVFWRQLDGLAEGLDLRTQSLGVAPHSLRAVALDEVVAIGEEAKRRDLVVHLHVEEQRGEVEEVESAYGARPLALLLDRVAPDLRFTAIHGIHCTVEDLAVWSAAGASLCLCPTTEGSLGDGIPRLAAPAAESAPPRHNFCLGSDSNNRISMLEEMRWLEYGQRLRNERRGLLADGAGRVARVLLAAATRGGARALGVDAGRIVAGAWADFVAVDLRAPSLAGATEETLLESLIFGAGEETIAATAVGGEWSAARSGPRGEVPQAI